MRREKPLPLTLTNGAKHGVKLIMRNLTYTIKIWLVKNKSVNEWYIKRQNKKKHNNQSDELVTWEIKRFQKKSERNSYKNRKKNRNIRTKTATTGENIKNAVLSEDVIVRSEWKHTLNENELGSCAERWRLTDEHSWSGLLKCTWIVT